MKFKMLKVMLRFAVCILIISLGAISVFDAPACAAAAGQDDLAARHLEAVQIEAQSIASLLQNFSLSYDIPVGFEAAFNEDELANYHLDFKKGSLSDLLNGFVSEHDRYSWKLKGGVVNIFPKQEYRDPLFKDLLATKISSFKVMSKTDCMSLAKSLTSTPEIREVLERHATTYRERNFSGAYFPQVGRDFTLDVSNMTLESTLNKVIRESPVARFWVVTRNSNDQTFFLSLGARFEGSPVATEKPGLSQN
jgi:hypothetical protein